MAEDKILKCKDCGQQFTFTVGEQEFYAQKGFENEPARCATCRRARKNQRTAMSSTQFRPRQPYGNEEYRPREGRSFDASYSKEQY
jgi:hypothetical protein